MNLDIIERQRAQLGRLHSRTTASIAHAFRYARGSALPAMERFTAAYAAELARVRNASGDYTARVSLTWTRTTAYMAAMRNPVYNAVQYAAGASLVATNHAQEQAYSMGSAGALDLMRSIGDGEHFTTVPTPQYQLGRSSYNGGVPIMSYFTALPPDAWRATQKAAGAGIAVGRSPDLLLGMLINAAFGVPQNRAELIGTGEATGAYRQMVSLTFQANPEAVHGWVWIAEPGISCPACTAMHGSIHDADEAMDTHAHCNCMQMPYIHQPPDIQTGEQWFAEQDADTQRDVVGPAAYGAMQNGDIPNLGRLIDTSDGYVTTASLKSLGLNASDYLS